MSKRRLIFIVLLVLALVLVVFLAFVKKAKAAEIDFVPYFQGTLYSDNDNRPNWSFGGKFEFKKLCFWGENIICKYTELVIGYDVARFTAENGVAVPCTNPDGCTSVGDSIPSMTRNYGDVHWDQTVFGVFQLRFKLLDK